MPSTYTRSGPELEDELRLDAERIDRKLVRFCLRWRPDWTGVRYKCAGRVSYSVQGQVYAYEESLGRLAISANHLERAEVQVKAVKLHARVLELCNELGLELRGASFE